MLQCVSDSVVPKKHINTFMFSTDFMICVSSRLCSSTETFHSLSQKCWFCLQTASCFSGSCCPVVSSSLLLQNISCVTFTNVETSSPPNVQSGSQHVASDMCRNITAKVLSPLIFVDESRVWSVRWPWSAKHERKPETTTLTFAFLLCLCVLHLRATVLISVFNVLTHWAVISL